MPKMPPPVPPPSPNPIQGVLKPLPNAASTVAVAATTHTLTTAALSMNSPGQSVLPIVVPLLMAGPAPVAGIPSVRNSLTIINPTDGKLVYIGQDATMTASAHLLFPGNSLTITGYTGPIWVLSSNGAATLFYQTT